MTPTLITVSQEFSRPADTAAYSSQDAVSTSTSAPTAIEFPDTPAIHWGAERRGYVVGARLWTDNIATESRFRLHLFNSPPAAIDDNAVFDLSWAGRSGYLGQVSFDYVSPESSASTAAFAQSPCLIAYREPTIYGLLETLDGFTPTSGQQFRIDLDHSESPIPARDVLFSTTNLRRQLVGYWRLDGSVDSSTSGLSLTNNNSTTFTAGKIGSASSFSMAAFQYLSRSSVAVLQFGDTDFTVAGWIKVNSSILNDAGIINRFTATGTQQWAIYARSTDVRFSVSNDGTNTGRTTVINSTPPSPGEWLHFIAEHDSTADEIRLRINNGTPETASHTGGVSTGNSPELRIGRLLNVYWNGLIDEVAIWRRLLSDDERAEVFARGDAGKRIW